MVDGGARRQGNALRLPCSPTQECASTSAPNVVSIQKYFDRIGNGGRSDRDAGQAQGIAPTASRPTLPVSQNSLNGIAKVGGL